MNKCKGSLTPGNIFFVSSRNVTLTFSYAPLTLFKFNMYAAMSRDNPWTNIMGGSDPDDDEQDTIKVGCVYVLYVCVFQYFLLDDCLMKTHSQ